MLGAITDIKGGLGDRKKLLLVESALILAGIIFSPVASAEEPARPAAAQAESLYRAIDEGRLSMAELDNHQKSLLRAYTTPGELIVKRLPQPSNLSTKLFAQDEADYCRKDGARFEQKAVMGNTLYTYWQTVEICGTPGKKIKNVKVLDHGGETSTPTWSYRGSASNPASYAVGAGWFVRTSENFEQSIVVDGIGAGQRTVCISATIRPSGEYNASERC